MSLELGFNPTTCHEVKSCRVTDPLRPPMAHLVSSHLSLSLAFSISLTLTRDWTQLSHVIADRTAGRGSLELTNLITSHGDKTDARKIQKNNAPETCVFDIKSDRNRQANQTKNFSRYRNFLNYILVSSELCRISHIKMAENARCPINGSMRAFIAKIERAKWRWK